MGTLAPDIAKDAYAEIHLLLGLTKPRKGVVGFPWVLSLFSSLFERSVEKNEILVEAAESKEVVSVFNGLRAPKLSIRKYIDRIFKYAGCSPSCFVIAQIYVDRFLDCAKLGRFFNNAYYAKVGGVTTTELNRLEMEFLFSIDFRLKVSIDTLKNYCRRLEREASQVLQIERPIVIEACGKKGSWSSKDDSTCASTTARREFGCLSQQYIAFRNLPYTSHFNELL